MSSTLTTTTTTATTTANMTTAKENMVPTPSVAGAKPTAGAKTAKRRRRDRVDKRHGLYTNAVRKCNLHAHHSTLPLSSAAVSAAALVVGDVTDRVVQMAKLITDTYGRKLLQSRALLAAIELELPPSLSKRCTDYCQKRMLLLVEERWDEC